MAMFLKNADVAALSGTVVISKLLGNLQKQAIV